VTWLLTGRHMLSRCDCRTEPPHVRACAGAVPVGTIRPAMKARQRYDSTAPNATARRCSSFGQDGITSRRCG